MTDKVIKIFVYGTLKENGHFFYNSILMENRVDIIKNCFIYGKLYDLGSFPTIKTSDKKDNDNIVYGELHTFIRPSLTLKTMDTIEGYNEYAPERSLFTRKIAKVYLETNNKKEIDEAYIYELVGEVSEAHQIKTWEV